MKLPVLVDCEPYGARLLEERCVERYEKAQTISTSGKGKKPGHEAMLNGVRRGVLAACKDCAVGKARAGARERDEVG